MLSRGSVSRRTIGLLGSWALFVLGFGAASIAVAGQWINMKDSRKLERFAAIEKLLVERVAVRSAQLQEARKRSESSGNLVRSKMETASNASFRSAGTRRISAFPAVGVPTDEQFVELARTKGLNVVHLETGWAVYAETGRAAQKTGGGVWDWIGAPSASRRVLTVVNNTVVEVANGVNRELPPGTLILAGGTLVIPPFGSPQRTFELAPPPVPEKKTPKIEEAESPKALRGKRLREEGSSIFGGKKRG
jgi:hypothetical protein